ncbi:MAG: toll/interleukin-1 receptor domain-containing protein [Planctomycetes bacterium]|nr:toll/interleukin-1 receptor domain-containing protein [Planctomycetota bacterium]
MAYKVFISHSTMDSGIVKALANILSKFGVTPYVADWDLPAGMSLNKGISSEIDKADCIIVLLTHNGIRSKWVHQEIGYARKSAKLIIPLVERGTTPDELGFLKPIRYIEYDPIQPHLALTRASTQLVSLKLKKEEKEKQTNALLVTGGILAFLLLLGGGEK